MDVNLTVEKTPNPNALKFVLDRPVKSQGNVTYYGPSECFSNLMAKEIFWIDHCIQELYFYDNYITVTKNDTLPWEKIEEEIRSVIISNAEIHNPDFAVPKHEEAKKGEVEMGPELAQIDAILDETVRPALQQDGGDVEVKGFENNVVKIFYQGACGSCPSSTSGTLSAIENILKERFHPDITVELT